MIAPVLSRQFERDSRRVKGADLRLAADAAVPGTTTLDDGSGGAAQRRHFFGELIAGTGYFVRPRLQLTRRIARRLRRRTLLTRLVSRSAAHVFARTARPLSRDVLSVRNVSAYGRDVFFCRRSYWECRVHQ